jgi:superfamily II DNA/RNA helicase
LDIPHIRTVVNFDIARDIDTHTHRIGRTGRAGEKGSAYTLVTEKDFEFAGHLVRNLEGAGQPVPQDLLDLAMKVRHRHMYLQIVVSEAHTLMSHPTEFVVSEIKI